ncbi:MAG: flippase [Actinobacteria bacterium]|nr:flippase [Actinomycetota bacterium]
MSKHKTGESTLTSGRLLVKNTGWNLVGQSIPLLVGIITIPFLIRGLEIDRFGVLTLVWILIGYFSLFDFGLGRALTKLVAEKLGAGEEYEIPPLIWTGLSIMMVLGAVGALVLGLLSSVLVTDVLKVPEDLQSETIKAFYLLALSVPLVVGTAGLGGILEAHQRFDLLNAVRVPMGIFMYAGPLLVLPFTNNLVIITAVLAAGRLIAMLVHLILCFHIFPGLRREFRLQRSVIKSLFLFGSWMTVSNIISPIMVRFDRFLIGAMISVTAVAYYSTPYEVVTKLLLVPAAVVGVLFPAFITSFAQDKKHTQLLFMRGVKYIFLSLFPVTLVIVTLAHEGLNLWLGEEFAQNSTRVLQLLAIGVLVNGIAQIPFGLIQGAGRPDITAKFHMFELPIYLGVLWWVVRGYGIEGAAIAWVVRALLDAVLLFAFAGTLINRLESAGMKKLASLVTGVLIVLVIAMLPMGFAVKVVFLTVALASFIMLSWSMILDGEERSIVQKRLGTVLAFGGKR